MASATPPARPVGFAAAGRPDANPPEGLATWTGPTPATWPTPSPSAAPVHSTLRANPNPHPTATWDRPCWSETTAWEPPREHRIVPSRPPPHLNGGALPEARPFSRLPTHPDVASALGLPANGTLGISTTQFSPILRAWSPCSSLIATAPNGGETLGLRPALRQAAPEADEVEGGRSHSDQATVGRTTSPFGDSFGVCSPLPQHRGGAACLRDMPCGHVVSPLTFGERDS